MKYLRYILVAMVFLLAGCGKKPEVSQKWKLQISKVYVKRFYSSFQYNDSKLVPTQVKYSLAINIKINEKNPKAFPSSVTAKIKNGAKQISTQLKLKSIGTSIDSTTVKYYLPEDQKVLDITAMQIEVNMQKGKQTIPYTLKCSASMLAQIRSVL